jgi:hypothetical protein
MAVLQQARLNTFRLNASRLNYYRAVYRVEINGVVRNLRIANATISQQLNHLPDTASFRVSGFTPVAGQRIDVWVGQRSPDMQLFGGRILQTTAVYEGERPALVAYDIACIDPTWLLDRKKVIWTYTGFSATAIVLSIVSGFTRGVTTNNVAANLPVVDEIQFTNETVSDALSRIADRIGGYWYVDYSGDLHFFLDEGLTAAPITQAQPRGSRRHSLAEDLSQVATRIVGRGGGANAMADVAVGGTSIPVDESVWYNAAGGLVEVGTQVVSYTGVAGAAEGGGNTGIVGPPAAAPIAVAATGGPMPIGTYQVGYTWITNTGETNLGPTKAVTLTSAGSLTAIMCDPLPAAPDPAVKKIGVYCSTTNGAVGTCRLVAEYDPYVQTWVLINAVPAGTQRLPPAANAAGGSTVPIPAGATSMPIDELTPFLTSGWAVAPGNQVFRYTGKSAASGPGSLTGIPASGPGSITAPIRAGTVKNVAHLIGIPASGGGSIFFAIKTGAAVNIRLEVYDATAAQAMANRLNITPVVEADGEFVTFVDDGRYALAELQFVINAYIRDRKTPQQTVTFESRDDTLKIGRTVAINLATPAIVGTYRITSIQFSEIAIGGGAAPIRPLRTITASNKLYSFSDLLRRVRA